MTSKTKELQVLNLNSPSEIMGFSQVLRKFITDNKLSVKIQGNEYAMTDGWKFAGMNFGVVPIVGEPEKISTDGQIATVLFRKEHKQYGNKAVTIDVPFFSSVNESRVKDFDKDISKKAIMDYYAYKCGCQIINMETGKQVGAGWATCSNIELKKVTFDEYAIASMAQTRAIGKAFRNLMGFVMKAAGFEPTPGEETDNVGEGEDKVTDQPSVDQVKDELKLLNDLEELEKYWHQLSASLQNNKDVISAFKIRKNEIKK